jgi:integrase
MARGGMRVGEVLKLRLKDLQDQKLILEGPKSGKEQEIVFIPQKVAERLRDYAHQVCKKPEDRIFPISYQTLWVAKIPPSYAAGWTPIRYLFSVPASCARVWSC